MHATELLRNDHRTVESLFQRFEQSSPGDADLRRDLVEQIVRELSIHASIEEQVLYPEAGRALAEGEDKIDEALDEHQEAKEALAELDGKDPDDPDFEDEVRSLIRDVRHHVEEEEGDLFPKLEDSIPTEQLEKMGQTMERLKGLAPTRPHPRAPSRPPANIVAGGVAGVMDRARDAVTGRGRRATTAPAAKRSSTGPRKTTGGRKASAKKATTRKATTRKATTRKATTRKATTRKATTRKATTSKASTSARATASKRAASARTRARTATRKALGGARGAEYHVIPDGQGGWKAERRGSSRALARGDRKPEVVRKARDAAKKQKGQLIIHNARGRIQEERTYGSDPSRTKG